MDFLGIIGSVCFAFCLLPQVVKVYREKYAGGVSWLFVLLSFGGNVASCGYVLYTNVMAGVYQWPLYFNYGFAWILCVLLIVAKFVYGGSDEVNKILQQCEMEALQDRVLELNKECSFWKKSFEVSQNECVEMLRKKLNQKGKNENGDGT